VYHGGLDVEGVGRVGQNIAFSGGPRWPITKAVERWYGELPQYDFTAATFKQGTGHFSQAVWKATTRVGCGVARGPKGTYIVCCYHPPGNLLGSFRDNVLPPIGSPGSVPQAQAGRA
jgi:hypothetical protein